MDVVLVAPEIATNTGNIIRLCANTGVDLHLVEPLGFSMDDRLLRRAGLDYHEHASVAVHHSVADCRARLGRRRWFAFSTRGPDRYDTVRYRDDDVLVFGAERAGLTGEQFAGLGPTGVLRIPMRPENRSLNLANAVAIVVYEAWRQRGFPGGVSAATTSETPGLDPFDD